MSIAKRNDAAIVGVDSSTADVLRQQTLATLEANHYYFEDLREFGPEAQFALSVRYRDAESDPAMRAEIDAAIATDRQAAITLDALDRQRHRGVLSRRSMAS
jgi:hypothetical protein